MESFNYLEYDAVALAKIIKRGELSPVELLKIVIDKIEELNPLLNCVTNKFYEYAKNNLKNGMDDGPFYGVPLLVKDMLEIKDLPFTMASNLMAGNIGKNTHVYAEKLISAGFNIVGSTNMSELGLLPLTESALYGSAKNPWDLSLSTGGSSGGAASAVAAGIVPVAHGMDGGGSIRIPSSACGVFGLKPSRGRNPVTVDDSPDDFIYNHVITRSVRDSAAILDVTSYNKPDGRWHLTPNTIPYSKVLNDDPGKLKIAFCTKNFMGEDVHPDCKKAVEHSAKLCENLGHFVEEAKPNINGHIYNLAFKNIWLSAVGHFYKKIQTEVTNDDKIPSLLRKMLKNRSLLNLFISKININSKGAVEPFTQKLAKLESKLSVGELWVSAKGLRQAEFELNNFLSEYDLLLTPVMGDLPLKIGSFNQNASIDEIEALLYKYVAFTPIANTGGNPAMSVPLYWNKDNIPVGSQFIASIGREDLLLQLATQLEKVQPWFNKRVNL